MIKNRKNKNNSFENEIFDDMENVSIEEIDEDMKDFEIDKEKIDNIKYSFDKDSLIKDSIDKAESDMKKSKLRKNIVAAASVVLVTLSIGVYSPALAHFSPYLMGALEKVNNFLKIDEITSFLEIDTIIPRAVLDEDENLKFVKVTRYKVNTNSLKEKVEIEEINKTGEISNEAEVVNFIHQMSNQIINPVDGKKYGVLNITPNNIEIALKSIKNINDQEARDYLSTELSKWKEGVFSNAVEVHNYVWHMLGGNIGRASSLDDKKIDDIVNKYFK